MKATAARSIDVLRAKCPNCGRVNEFPDFNQIEMFICTNRGDLIEIERTSYLSSEPVWRKDKERHDSEHMYTRRCNNVEFAHKILFSVRA